MILTDSTAAEVGTSDVKAIISITSLFQQFMCYAAITLSQAIGGAKGLIKNGAGGLTFDGAISYTGNTQINDGQIVIRGGPSLLNGVISGTGVLTKTGTTSLTLGGNNTYSGGTVYAPSSASPIIIFYSTGSAFGTGLFTLQGAHIISTAGAITLPNNFQLNSGSQLQFRTTGAPPTGVSGNIAGAGGINKFNNGTLTLSGNLTYTGSTTRTAGNLVAFATNGASTATATFGASLSVSFNVPPTIGMTFRFFQGLTTNSYPSVFLVNATGRTGVYTSANSTLTIS